MNLVDPEWTAHVLMYPPWGSVLYVFSQHVPKFEKHV